MSEYNETVKKIQRLFETPYVMPGNISFIDDLGGGVVLGQRAISEGKLIAEIHYRGSDLKCYEITINDFIYNIWVSGELTRCYILYKKIEDGMIEKAVEQGISITGIARYLYINFYLKKYNFIISDSIHTEKGKSFWIKLTAELPLDKFKIFVVRKDGEVEIQPQDVAKYFTKQVGNFSRIKVVRV